MAAGEYVSVSSQRDTEMADVDKERQEQERGPEARAHELEELVQIYIDRGLTADLARQVAVQLTAKDPVRAHARDELGIDIDDYVNPWVAAGSSAVCCCPPDPPIRAVLPGALSTVACLSGRSQPDNCAPRRDGKHSRLRTVGQAGAQWVLSSETCLRVGSMAPLEGLGAGPGPQ